MKKSRGLRNNNPGNIRKSKDAWQGLAKEQTDNSFFQFSSIEYGYRALIRILQNYRKKRGCNTIDDFIRRWAPECENDTNAYIQSVCQQLQVPSSYVPDVDDKGTMCAFAAAISRVENGVEANLKEVEGGWNLL